jgi:DNA polymerase III delta subunit
VVTGARAGRPAELRYSDLAREIAKSGPAPVTLLKIARDTAALLAEDLAVRIAEAFLGPGGKPERIRGGDEGAGERIASLRNFSLFDARRVVLVHSPGELPPAAWEELARLLVRVPESLRLVLVSPGTGVPGPRRGRKKSGEGALGDDLESRIHAAGGRVATLWPPFANQLPAWIERRGASLGLRIPAEIAVEILARAGPDLRELANEIEKLRLAMTGRDTVTREDLRVLARGIADDAAFAFLDALDTRDLVRIVRALSAALEADPEGIALVALAGGHIVRLLVFEDARRAGRTDLARAAGVPDWKLPSIAAAAARFDRDELIDLVGALSDIDRALKSGSGPAESHLSLLAVRAAQGPMVP